MRWIKRIVGCVGISLVSTLCIVAAIYCIGKLWWNAEPSGLLYLWTFTITTVLFLACLLLYRVNMSLWDSVYKAKEEQGSVFLRLMPNIKVIVMLIDYMGHVTNNKSKEGK